MPTSLDSNPNGFNLPLRPAFLTILSDLWFSGKLWTAPEKLRSSNNFLPEAYQRADVYSFAIIVHEISFRRGPFYVANCNMEPCREYSIDIFLAWRAAYHTSYLQARPSTLVSVFHQRSFAYKTYRLKVSRYIYIYIGL